jgi:hypothetical protein
MVVEAAHTIPPVLFWTDSPNGGVHSAFQATSVGAGGADTARIGTRDCRDFGISGIGEIYLGLAGRKTTPGLSALRVGRVLPLRHRTIFRRAGRFVEAIEIRLRTCTQLASGFGSLGPTGAFFTSSARPIPRSRRGVILGMPASMLCAARVYGLTQTAPTNAAQGT